MTAFTDTGTISSKTTPSSIDVESSIDSATVSSTTTYSGIDVIYRDADILQSVTTISAEEEFVHPTGSWGPFDDDSGSL